MNKKAIIGLMACLALIVPVGVVSAGDATVTLANTPPTIVSYDIRDATNIVINGVSPMVSCFLTITVNDVDGWDDLVNTTMQFKYPNTPATNDPSGTYKVAYNETNGEGYLIYPTTNDGYLGTIDRIPSGLTQMTYKFELIVNGTAKDTNGALTWGLSAITKDISGASATTVEKYHSMGAYIQITYTGNAGGQSFSWAGVVGANISASFTTTVTSNDVYTLDASYSGVFTNVTSGATWGIPLSAPTFWVKQTSQSISQKLPTGTTNVTWFTNTGIRYEELGTHLLFLTFPAGLDKDYTYTGVTIWIQARNS